MIFGQHNAMFGPAPAPHQLGGMGMLHPAQSPLSMPHSPYGAPSQCQPYMASHHLSAGHPNTITPEMAMAMKGQRGQHPGFSSGGQGRPRLLTSAAPPGTRLRGDDLMTAGMHHDLGLGGLASPTTPVSPGMDPRQQLMMRQQQQQQQSLGAYPRTRSNAPRGMSGNPHSAMSGMQMQQDPRVVPFSGDHILGMDDDTASYIMGDDFPAHMPMQQAGGRPSHLDPAFFPTANIRGLLEGNDEGDFDMQQEIDMTIKMKVNSRGSGRGRMSHQFGMGMPQQHAMSGHAYPSPVYGDESSMSGTPGYPRQRAATPF